MWNTHERRMYKQSHLNYTYFLLVSLSFHVLHSVFEDFAKIQRCFCLHFSWERVYSLWKLFAYTGYTVLVLFRFFLNIVNRNSDELRIISNSVGTNGFFFSKIEEMLEFTRKYVLNTLLLSVKDHDTWLK